MNSNLIGPAGTGQEGKTFRERAATRFRQIKAAAWQFIKKGMLLLGGAAIGYLAGVVIGGMPAEEPRNTVPPIIADNTITEPERKITVSNVEEVLDLASDLVTTKYRYKDADISEAWKEFFDQRVPFTTNKTVFTYSGTISLGIDLEKVVCVVDNANMAITIALPKIEITANEIDASSFEYVHTETTIFNPQDMGDTTDLIAILKANKAQEVLADNALMDEALANTKMILRNQLTGSDITSGYRIIFK